MTDEGPGEEQQPDERSGAEVRGGVEALLDRVPTTSKAAAYGTPEMAYEIMRLFKTSDAQRREILAMAGHEGGIVSFGKNLQRAFEVLMCEREMP